MAHRFKQQIQENKPLTNRDKRIIERFRSGADFFWRKNMWQRNIKTIRTTIYFLIYLMSGRKKHFKEHPEDKDKTIEELFDIRLSEQKLYHSKEVNGKYYGAEIPKRNTLHRIFPISIFQCKV